MALLGLQGLGEELHQRHALVVLDRPEAGDAVIPRTAQNHANDPQAKGAAAERGNTWTKSLPQPPFGPRLSRLPCAVTIKCRSAGPGKSPAGP